MSSFSTPIEKVYKALAVQTAAKQEQLYVFISKTSPWNSSEFLPEFVPENPSLDQRSLNNYLNNIISLKRVLANDVSLAIRRYDWISGRIYDTYDCSDANLLFKHKYINTNPFYVITDEYNVYKCLDNNNESLSVSKPTGQLTQPFQLEDGYIWKFMFNVPEADRVKFLTSTHIPIFCNTDLPSDCSQKTTKDAAVFGTIHKVDILSGGSGYTGQTTISMAGDGSGFSGTAVVSNGSIQHIDITNSGQSYSTATLTATNTNPSYVPASFRVQLSPQGGHGFDACKELGAFYVICSVDLIGYQDTIIPVNIYFRQTGLISEILDIEDNFTSPTYFFGPEHPLYTDASIRSTFPQRVLKPKIGHILYIKNHAPILRSLYQLERLKFVVEIL